MSQPATPREPLFTAKFLGMWCYSFVTFFSAFQLLPAIPFRILELGGSTAAAGSFLAVYTFASAFAAPVMGTIADHIGRRRALVSASLLFIGFSLAYGMIHNLALLLVVGAIHGSIWSAILASSSAIMTDFIPESRRTEGFAYWGTASNLAVAIAPAAGLFVYHYGWLTLCIELAVIAALMAITGTLIPGRDEILHHRAPRLAETWDWRVTQTALSLAVTAIGYGGVTSYAAMLAIHRHIHPPSLYFTVFAISTVVVRLFTSRLGDRFGPRAILFPALAAVPVAFVLLALCRTRGELVASAVLFGAGFGSMYPAFAAFILANTDPRRRARTFGSIVWAFDTGIGSGSLLLGAIVQRHGYSAAFLVAAAVSCLAVPIFLFTSRRLVVHAERVRPS